MSAQRVAEDLAERLHLRRRPRSWGGDCPSCGYRGSFWIKASPKFARPSLHCSNGCTRDQLTAEAERILQSSWAPPPAQDQAERADARAKMQDAARKLFAGAMPVTASDPAGLYLARRGLQHLIGSPALRFRADCSHPEAGRLRAMVALVQDAAGAPLAAHRTYLAPDGSKADVDPPKASLGPCWGGAVRLDPVGPELAIGEGLESAASAGLLLGLPCWAALSAGNLAAGLVLPLDVRKVVVAADNDEAGRRAATDAARRWRAEGRTVYIATPDRAGRDFNDLLLERVHA